MKYFSFVVCLCALLMGGCRSLLTAKVQQFGQDFSSAILENDDVVTLEQGLPAYLLLLDALIKNQPQQVALLDAAANLNSAYASAFVSDAKRAKLLNNKALNYAFEALCLHKKELCQLQKVSINEMAQVVSQTKTTDVAALYTTASVWAGWIQVHSDDWNAIADLARVRILMQRVVALDEHYQQGEAHLYLGVLATFLPPALGGQSELGRQHFDKALVLSQQRHLMVKVYYAKNYARGIFDRELHDKLLNEVLSADVHAGTLTLSNVLAQQQAKILLQSADDYF